MIFYADYWVIISRIHTNEGEEFGKHHGRASNSKEKCCLGNDFRPGLQESFAQVCDEHKTRDELTSTRRPAHGLATRWDKTVLTMVKSMLFAAKILHIVWPAAVVNRNMLRNRMPIRGLGDFSPYELLFRRRPHVST